MLMIAHKSSMQIDYLYINHRCRERNKKKAKFKNLDHKKYEKEGMLMIVY